MNKDLGSTLYLNFLQLFWRIVTEANKGGSFCAAAHIPLWPALSPPFFVLHRFPLFTSFLAVTPLFPARLDLLLEVKSASFCSPLVLRLWVFRNQVFPTFNPESLGMISPESRSFSASTFHALMSHGGAFSLRSPLIIFNVDIKRCPSPQTSCTSKTQ